MTLDAFLDLLDSPLPRNLIMPTLAATLTWATTPEPPLPQAGDRWFLSVRAPESPGRERFARLYADPVGDRWAVQVTCGTVSLRDGKERVELQATGDAGRSRRGDLGWTWTPVGGGPTGGGGFVRERGLEPDVVMAAPCPSGRGGLSSGD
jgi:hypothetical protein